MTAGADKRLVLEVVGTPGAPVELPRQGVLTIGSDPVKADLCVDGQGVADVHCAIGKSKSGGFALKDLGSQYGTLVNGKPVTATRLEPGDVIAVGSRRLRIVDPDAVQAGAGGTTKFDTQPLGDSAASVTGATPSAGSGTSAPKLEPVRVDAKSEPPLRATQLREAQFEPPLVRGYRVEKLLGKGGMGEVWLAVQERLERQVALKVLKRQLSADADFVRRFLAEARAAAALNHPNVVVVYDAGEDDGHHFLSMEFMDKGNLESRVAKSGRMPWKEVLGVLVEAAKGLQYAEAKGIVHRDIKPANLMQNSAGVTKIADLGLASHLDAEATQSEGRKIFGTPHFVSPEQARGERVDHRSDLYSLGATAYRLLSGRTPFEGATTRDILRGHFTEAPKPLASLVPDVPAELARVVHQLLAKKPDERFPNAAALLAALEVLTQPAIPQPVTRVVAPKKSTAVLPVLGLVILGVVGYWVYSERQKQTGDRLDRPDRDGAANAPAKLAEPGDVVAEPAQGGGATAPGEVQGAANAPVAKGAEDDTRLKMRELEAQIAYRDLSKDLDDAGRRDALVKLAADFPGTTVATQALAEAQELATRAATAARVEGARSEAVGQVLARLSSTVAGAAPTHVGSTLSALRLVEGQEPFEGDPDFVAKRRELVGSVLIAGANAVRGALEDVRKGLERGAIDDAAERLVELEAELALPETPADLPQPALVARLDLEQLGRTARAWHDKLVEIREAWRDRHRAEESRAVAAGFGGPNGLERELGSFDFAAAKARIEALRARTTTPELAADLATLASDLERGERMLVLVGTEFTKGNWRRKTIADPRKGKATNRNAVGADANGVSIEGDGGVETIPWSAFGARPKELHQLFHERLTREWTVAEQAAIAALLRISAISAALDGASEMLQTAQRATFSEGEFKELCEGYKVARSWTGDAAETERVEREARAAELFGKALRSMDGGAWSAAATQLERFEHEHADTLLFRLLTGGPSEAVVAPRPLGLELPERPTAPPPATAPDPAASDQASDGAEAENGGGAQGSGGGSPNSAGGR